MLPNVDAFLEDLFAMFWADGGAGDIDGGCFQDLAEQHGIIARVECGGAEAACPICVEYDGDYHFERVRSAVKVSR